MSHARYHRLLSLMSCAQEYTGSKRDRKELQAWKARRSEEQERLAKQKSAWDRRQKERNRKRQKREEQQRKVEVWSHR